jgi:hypothetical protein
VSKPDDFFIGWQRDLPSPGRRAFIAGSAGLIVAAASAGVLAARLAPAPGPGVWDQSVRRTLSGRIHAAPYPHLLTTDLDGTMRTVFLVGPDKTALDLTASFVIGFATVEGTLITRGPHAMLAVMRAVPADAAPRHLPLDAPPIDLGEVLLTGEILDAKCWFGAMRPGYGKTHKACAALCARGRLPLAFCVSGSCAENIEAPLFLDDAGAAHAVNIFPLVGEPVIVKGRQLRIAGRLEFHVARSDIRRIRGAG